MFNLNFVDDWIRTVDLRYWKRPIYQLSDNHYPVAQSFEQDKKLTFKILLSAQVLNQEWINVKIEIRELILASQLIINQRSGKCLDGQSQDPLPWPATYL